jgi:hypothetical protein
VTQRAFRTRLRKEYFMDDLEEPSAEKLLKIMRYAAREGRADEHTRKNAVRILERYRAAYPHLFWLTDEDGNVISATRKRFGE